MKIKFIVNMVQDHYQDKIFIMEKEIIIGKNNFYFNFYSINFKYQKINKFYQERKYMASYKLYDSQRNKATL